MPNWCDNILTAEGSPQEVRAFVAAVKDGDEVLSFERLYPTPPALLDDDYAKAAGRESASHCDSNRGMPDWWHWRVEHWGTKWDACDAQITDGYTFDSDSVEYFLNTAWAPPEKWLTTIAPLFSRLRFTLRYVEEGMDFAGWLVCHGRDTADSDVSIPTFTEEQYDNGEGFWAHDITVPDDVLPVEKVSA